MQSNINKLVKQSNKYAIILLPLQQIMRHYTYPLTLRKMTLYFSSGVSASLLMLLGGT